MKLLADESVDHPIVENLRQHGHEVISVAEMEPGITDAEVLNHANKHKALLLTGDRDFGELVFRHNEIHHGIILIRLAGMAPNIKAGVVSDVIEDRSNELINSFSVISPSIVRIR
ncbi:MAG: hypothetical protein GWO07_06465, partial [Candidatus Dadabacteria bacterium]|nr:hypothetical protein [Candidatus Dadabacteria bacterium]NIV41400.1 hypothetical protein [Candidatus Dadabacteria bacterium]NIX16020.1 hypothetical protein [Candidatus Dadabacteria bacterium]